MEKEEENEERTREQNERATASQGQSLNDGLQKDADGLLKDLGREGSDIKVANTQNQNRNNALLGDASKQASDFPAKDSVDLNALTKEEEARNAEFTTMENEMKTGSFHDLEQAGSRTKGITAKVSTEITNLDAEDK